MLGIDDKPAADGVIGFGVQLFITGKCGDTHAVFVQRQVTGVEIHAAFTREVHSLLTIGQGQTLSLFDIADKTGDTIDIDSCR